MANNPGTLDPTRTTAPSSDYPYGSSKDETSPGAGDGTPYKLARANDIYGFQQALLKAVGIVPSGNADKVGESEYLQAVVEEAQGRASYMIEDAGSAVNAYILKASTDNEKPRSYFENMRVAFRVVAASTGAVTVDVAGLGSKGVRNSLGVALIGGEIGTGVINYITYDAVNGWFVLDRGGIVQTVNHQDGAVATGTNIIPLDDTVPQNTEGDEYMSLSITPTKATNKLLIEVVMQLASSDNTTAMIGALFQDATVNALAANFATKDGSINATSTVVFRHYMTAGTTSVTTFKVRGGVGFVGTTTFNGFSSVRKMGGVMASSITITEIEV